MGEIFRGAIPRFSDLKIIVLNLEAEHLSIKVKTIYSDSGDFCNRAYVSVELQ